MLLYRRLHRSRRLLGHGWELLGLLRLLPRRRRRGILRWSSVTLRRLVSHVRLLGRHVVVLRLHVMLLHVMLLHRRLRRSGVLHNHVQVFDVFTLESNTFVHLRARRDLQAIWSPTFRTKRRHCLSNARISSVIHSRRTRLPQRSRCVGAIALEIPTRSQSPQFLPRARRPPRPQPTKTNASTHVPFDNVIVLSSGSICKSTPSYRMNAWDSSVIRQPMYGLVACAWLPMVAT